MGLQWVLIPREERAPAGRRGFVIGSSGAFPGGKALLVDGKAQNSAPVGELRRRLELQVRCNVLTVTFRTFHFCM